VVVRKRRKGIYILPNLFTLAALFGGFYAVVMAMNQRFDMAARACSWPWCWTAWTAASRA
jgi:phosphatidylserine synthase